jgi:hypothetical protein
MRRRLSRLGLLSFAVLIAGGFLVASPLQQHDDGCSGRGCPGDPCQSTETARCEIRCQNKIDGIHCVTYCTCERDKSKEKYQKRNSSEYSSKRMK